jgi:hypothetical protein
VGRDVVLELVSVEQLLHLEGDLGVPVARQVREDVVLDLVGEVARQDVQQATAR